MKKIFLLLLFAYVAFGQVSPQTISTKMAKDNVKADTSRLMTGNVVSILDYAGADATQKLAAALGSIGSSDNTLVLPTGSYALKNITIPGNVDLKINKGVLITLDKADTLRINGYIDAPSDAQIFKGGTVILTNCKNEFIRPEWFGQGGAGIQKAIWALANENYISPSGDGPHMGRGIVQLSMAKYLLDSTLVVAQGITLRGVGTQGESWNGDYGTVLYLSNKANCDMIKFSAGSSTGFVHNIHISDLVLLGNKAVDSRGNGINYSDRGSESIYLERLLIKDMPENGILIPRQAVPCYLSNLRFVGNKGAGIFVHPTAATGIGVNQIMHFSNISGDGNKDGLIKVDYTENVVSPNYSSDIFLFDGIKHEQIMKVNNADTTYEGNYVIYLKNMRGAKVEINGLSSLTGQTTTGSYSKRVASNGVIITGTNAPSYVNINSGDVRSNWCYLLIDSTTSPVTTIPYNVTDIKYISQTAAINSLSTGYTSYNQRYHFTLGRAREYWGENDDALFGGIGNELSDNRLGVGGTTPGFWLYADSTTWGRRLFGYRITVNGTVQFVGANPAALGTHNLYSATRDTGGAWQYMSFDADSTEFSHKVNIDSLYVGNLFTTGAAGTGEVGGYLLDGTSNGIILNGLNSAFSYSGAMEVWFKTGANVSTAQYIRGGAAPRVYIEIESGHLNITLGSNSPHSITTISANTLYHVVIVWTDKNNHGTGTVDAYVNNVKKLSGTAYDSFTSFPNPLYVGSSNGSSGWFSGQVYLIRHFNVSLTPAQVSLLYNNGRPDQYHVPNSDRSNLVGEYLPENAGRMGWIETSGNHYSGSTMGNPVCLTTVIRPIVYRDIKNLIANTTTPLTAVVPKGYVIREIRVKGTDAITGVKIGTTSEGEEVVASTTASATASLLKLTATANNGYSETADQTLYVEHATPGKTIEVIFKLEKISE